MVQTIAGRLRDRSAVQTVIVTYSAYFIGENIDWPEYKFRADSASRADEEIAGRDTDLKVEGW